MPNISAIHKNFRGQCLHVPSFSHVCKDTGLQNQDLKESAACLCSKVSEYDIMRGWVSFTENFYCAIITDKIK